MSGSYLGVTDLTAQLFKIFCKLRHLITARVYPAQQKKQASLSISPETRATTQKWLYDDKLSPPFTEAFPRVQHPQGSDDVHLGLRCRGITDCTSTLFAGWGQWCARIVPCLLTAADRFAAHCRLYLAQYTPVFFPTAQCCIKRAPWKM